MRHRRRAGTSRGFISALGLARLVAAAALVVSACSGGARTPAPSTAASAPPSTAGGLTIYAASSLTSAFKDLATAYETATGTSITLSFDASSALEAQIEQGAPADILASADTANPQKLETAKLAAGTPINFAGNVLTIIVPASGSNAVAIPADLAKAGVKIIAAGDAVPITKYANQLIANLAKQPGYPANFAAAVAANVVSKEDNVKAVVSKVELGEGDAGIVYLTDARASTNVKSIDVPATANVPATYTAVALKASKNATAAQAFLAWLTDTDAQAILAKYGFLAPNSSRVNASAEAVHQGRLGRAARLRAVTRSKGPGHHLDGLTNRAACTPWLPSPRVLQMA
jgi:molybdate transport system substrate-binding protein